MSFEATDTMPVPQPGPAGSSRQHRGPGDDQHVARTFGFWRARVSISVNVPKAVVETIKRLKRSVPFIKNDNGLARKEHLLIAPKVPPLHVKRRHPDEYMPFYRSFNDAAERSAASPPSSELARRVAKTSWYHTIELPGGVVTPGIYDHRELVPHYGIPADLEGKRILDVATFDGFWAFEFERRGAEVTALDIGRISQCDIPDAIRQGLFREDLDRATGEGFHLAHAALQSKVNRVEGSVYDLDSSVLGRFDLVHVGDLLLHLENPVAALRAIHRVTAGRALISDCVDTSLRSGATQYIGGWSSAVWWLPSLDTLGQMIIDAGFADVSVQTFYSLGNVSPRNTVWRAVMLATPS